MTRLAWLMTLAIASCMPAVSAAQVQEEVVYFHTDAVGSVRMITDANGQVIARYDYLPFGEPWPADPTLPETRQFTGQERDAETGFDYFGARHYANGNGRFTTPDDPAYIDPFHPKSTNLYLYAYNNPLSYIDPTGHFPEVAGELGFDQGLSWFFWESLTGPIKSWYAWRMDQEHEIQQQNNLWEACINAMGGGMMHSVGICSDFGFEPVVTESAVGGARMIVYRSLNALGKVQYVGITKNFARRAAEHLRSKRIDIDPLMRGLSKSDARAVEQALMQIHGLGKHGGTLSYNLINSIARTNPAYAQQVQRGYELLRSIGYK